MPFAGYKDFAECVRKNRNKKNPEAYCAEIMRRAEKEPGSRSNIPNERGFLMPEDVIESGDSGIVQSDGSTPVATEEDENDFCEIAGKKLGFKERKSLPDSSFCYVKTSDGKKVRKFPAQDAAHVRNGLARLSQSDLSAEEKAAVRKCLVSRAKKFGIEVSDRAKSTRDIPISEKFHDLTEDVLIEGGKSSNIVWVKATKVGAKAYTSLGLAVEFTKEALEANHSSWKGGIVTVNHKKHVAGGILKTKFADPFVMMAVRVDDPKLKTMIRAGSVDGVSIEAEDVQLEGDKITAFRGTGISFVVYPERPACDDTEGCGIMQDAEAAKPAITDPLESLIDLRKPAPPMVNKDEILAKKLQMYKDLGLEFESSDPLSDLGKISDEIDVRLKKIQAEKLAAAKPAGEDHYSLHGGDCKCLEKAAAKPAEPKIVEPPKKDAAVVTETPTVVVVLPETAKPAVADAPIADVIVTNVAAAVETDIYSNSTAATVNQFIPVITTTTNTGTVDTTIIIPTGATNEPVTVPPKIEEPAPCGCKELEAAVITAKEINDKQGGVIENQRLELEKLRREVSELRLFRKSVLREPFEARAKNLGLPDKVIESLDNDGLKLAVEAVEKTRISGSGAVTGTTAPPAPRPAGPTNVEIDAAVSKFLHKKPTLG